MYLKLLKKFKNPINIYLYKFIKVSFIINNNSKLNYYWEKKGEYRKNINTGVKIDFYALHSVNFTYSSEKKSIFFSFFFQ
jgi:hypothetical protein